MPNLTVSADIDSFMQSANKAAAVSFLGALTTSQIAGLSTTAPAALATTGVVGLSTFAARADHQHLFPTAAQVGAPSTSRTISAGTGLTGGGDLSADRTLSLDVPVSVANGGTGATSNEAARTVLGSLQNVTVRHSSVVNLASAGTLSGASWTSGSPIVTFTGSTATLVPGMSISASGLTTAVIRTVDSATQVTMSTNATAGGSGSVTVYNSTVSSLVSSGIFTVDGRTLLVGDIVCFMAQTANAQNGVWVVSSIGTGITFTRPSWFAGNSVLTGAQLLNVQSGTSNTGTLVSLFPNIASTSSTIGIDGIAAITFAFRSTPAILAANTFTGVQTFAAATATGNAPFKFQTGVLNTTPVAGTAEWDGSTMYLTTAAAVRQTNVTAVAVPASSTASGVAGTIAYDTTNIYVCVATNTWRRAALTTF